MRNKNFSFITLSFIVFLVNAFVFLSMGQYVNEHPDFMNLVMYYLSFVFIICSIIVSFMGYRHLNGLTSSKKIIAHIIFWTHLLLVGIFLGSFIFSLNS
ncbi:hypothetical protein [Acholeplasma hippikon]|uniref:Uncharacterized protein n=1 Tax=Acholeplasma hippikon TaxID=264636 RepID=A0A449BJ07_9MOLU|nr:hypothetical protein [Acholeplasma hippikon]VEU82418.1 Uncharacterised protein [Acholeplasma hippikon]